MANENERSRAGVRAAAIGGRRAAPWAGAHSAHLSALRRWIEEALRAEADSARLAPWLPVLFGAGILLYFAAPQEPSPWAGCVSFLAFAGIAFLARERPFGFAVALALAAMAAGFAMGSLRGLYVAHPVLARPTQTVVLRGFIEARDATDRSDRVILRLTSAEGRGAEGLKRVRVSLRHGTAPEVGTHVEAKARLRPLLAPTLPGGYDYALGAYFARLGATGFVLGKAHPAAAPAEAPADIRLLAFIEHIRRALTARILAAIPGETGAVGTALISGVRDQIAPDVNEAMRISGLYHVLSISGLHMAIVTAVIFGLVRGGLALIPGFALRYPIKKWTAAVALAGSFSYMVLAGADAPTLRSFVMIALVLVGVMLDRPAITLRTLAIAAFVVLALAPEAVLNPGFQMSFAATLALVSIYQQVAPQILAAPPPKGSGPAGRLGAGVGKWILAGALTSLVAGLATTPYAAFHFHRLAPYGLIANVLAMPFISFIIMPMAVFGVILVPFGYDAPAWKAMGWGIDMMLAIARWVAALPGAEGRIPAFGAGALLLATLGLLLLALPVSRLKLLSAPFLALALGLALAAPKPDVLVDPEAKTVAVRGADGTLSILNARQGRIAAETWLAADGDTRKSNAVLDQGFRCDGFGCVARLRDGSLVAVASRPDAFADDCRAAGLVVSAFDIPARCQAPGIDRRTMQSTGAVSLRHVNGEWKIETVRALTGDRPWYARPTPADREALAKFRKAAAAPGMPQAESLLAPAGDIPVPEEGENSDEADSE